ncbi:hypothetical protein R3P38DRAFT_3432761 [Favolaschia claudopus]|uniref:Uncharacterized protein n=1 Tax=Favolaschia claudopus TaxID=2862362 RepID=A0AAW0D350_9AGAR
MEDHSLPTTTAHKRRAHYNAVNHFYARQLMATSSSYDYWWPYPPAGATTTTPTPVATPEPTTTLYTSPAQISIPTLAIFISSDSAFSSSLNSLSPTTSIISSASSDSPSASPSIVSISALPASNTSLPANDHHKLSMVPSSNLVYIVPICGIIGLLIGGFATWCAYGCINRNGHGRRRARKSYGTLEVGPEYAPPNPHPVEDDEDDEDAKEKSEQQGEWVGVEKRHHREEENVEDNPEEEASDGEERGAETQGFLHPGSAQPRSNRRANSDASTFTVSPATRKKSTLNHNARRGPSPSPSSRTSLSFYRQDSADAVPWESLRHKSIKRGILERLREEEDGHHAHPHPHPQPDKIDKDKERITRRPWQAHGRTDSDVLLADAQASLSRASSAASAALSRALSTVTISTAPGFRILSESPQRERGAEVFRWPSVNVKEDKDRYTAMPERSRSRSPEKGGGGGGGSPRKKYSGRGQSPTKYTPPGRGRPNAEARGEDYRSVLPRSPPLISSPVLDRDLCFTSPIPMSPPGETPEMMSSFASFGAKVAERGHGHKEGGWR